MRHTWAGNTLLVVSALALAGCGTGTASDTALDSQVLQGAPENQGTISSELSAGVPIGSTLKTTTALNLRTGAGTSYQVRLVIPSGATVTTVNTTQSTAGFYNVKYNGVVGWAYGSYLTLVTSGGGSTGGTTGTGGGSGSTGTGGGSAGTGGGSSNGGTSSSARDAAVARAQTGVGFSYWWGHGKWQPAGVSTSGAGVCTGNCPSCSHTGVNGADCSGYVGKIWQVGANNSDVTVDNHPYSTASFVGSNSQWSTVSRGAVQKGDALVYNQNGAGHIFLYESGDGWGSMWVYEAKGCSYGILHDLRTASSAYKAIARAGY
jgi:hypothetical protein